MPRFGFDSLADSRSIWDQAVSAAGRPPEFWVRYIGGPGAVTAAEVAALHARGVAVGLLYNATTAADVEGGAAAGQADAQAAIAAATALGAPGSVRLGVDIEAGWRPSGEYVRGWAEAQAAGPFAGSGLVYGAPYDPGFQAALQAAQAAGGAAAALVLWSAQPSPGPASTPEWGPATCWDYPVVLWQYALGAYGGIVDLDLAADAYRGLWEPAAVPASTPVFSDVPADAWFARAVAEAVEAHLMQGVGGGRFDPEAMAPRAELAVVAARVAERQGWASGASGGPPSFSDVPGDAWYAHAVVVAVEAGLMRGVGGGRFNPEGITTRADLAAIAARIALRAGWASGVPGPTPTFSDVPAEAWYARDVALAVETGLMQGVGGNRFAPEGIATRAELAAVAARVARRAGWVGAVAAQAPATPAPAVVERPHHYGYLRSRPRRGRRPYRRLAPGAAPAPFTLLPHLDRLPCLNQDQSEECVAFSDALAHLWHQLHAGRPQPELGSPSWLYGYTHRHYGERSEGLEPPQAFAVLRAVGLCPWGLDPFPPDGLQDVAQAEAGLTAAMAAAAAPYRIAGFAALEPAFPEIATALRHGPVLLDTAVLPAFEAPQPMPLHNPPPALAALLGGADHIRGVVPGSWTDQASLGGHQFLVVGTLPRVPYLPGALCAGAERYLICLTSWGRFGTGPQSLFLLPETYLTNASEAWVITGMARPARPGFLAALLRWLLRLLWLWEG